jgi:hypothetical protein
MVYGCKGELGGGVAGPAPGAAGVRTNEQEHLGAGGRRRAGCAEGLCVGAVLAPEEQPLLPRLHLPPSRWV